MALEHAVAPQDTDVAEGVDDEADRVAALTRIDVLLPQAAVPATFFSASARSTGVSGFSTARRAFACTALVPRANGYRFYLGVYVKPVSRFTPLYMAAIEPFRRFIVYPALVKRLRAAWQEAYPHS